MEKLDIHSLQNAVYSLRMSINKLEEIPTDDYVRDSVIQRFEYTYELCCKMLRRFLEIVSDNADEISRLSFPNLIRTANEQDLLLNEGLDKQFKD